MESARCLALLSLLTLGLSACAPGTVSDLNAGLAAGRALGEAPRTTLSCADEQGFTRDELRPGRNTCLLAVQVPENVNGLEVRFRVQQVYLESGGLFGKVGTKTRDFYAREAVNTDNPNVRGAWLALPFGHFVKRKSLTSLDLGRTFEELNAPDFQAAARLAAQAGVVAGLHPTVSRAAFYGGGLIASVTDQLRDIYRLDLNPIQVNLTAALCEVGGSTCSPTSTAFIGVRER